MDLKEALEFVLAGRAVLFTGAGFSIGALNLRGTPFKTGTAFANHLSRLAGLPDGTQLDEAAEWFAEQHGKGCLVEELQLEFTVKQVTPAQASILRRPWKRLYTTNYDNVAETAAAQEGKRLSPASLSDPIHELPRTGTLCVHLNGYIDRFNASTVDSEIKLTDTSYLTNIVKDSPWAVTFRQDLDAARAVFFLGYSTADIDIRRLLYERPSLKDKSFFVLGSHLSPVAKQKISRFGAILDMDLDAFSSALTQAESSYCADADQSPINYSVRQFTPPDDHGVFEDRFVFDLLLGGDIGQGFVWQSLHGHLHYFIESPVASAVLSSLKNDLEYYGSAKGRIGRASTSARSGRPHRRR